MNLSNYPAAEKAFELASKAYLLAFQLNDTSWDGAPCRAAFSAGRLILEETFGEEVGGQLHERAIQCGEEYLFTGGRGPAFLASEVTILLSNAEYFANNG